MEIEVKSLETGTNKDNKDGFTLAGRKENGKPTKRRRREGQEIS